MPSTKEFLKPNIKITFGIFWFAIAVIIIVDRLINHLGIRFWDWIGWIAMFTAGTVSFVEGVRMKRN